MKKLVIAMLLAAVLLLGGCAEKKAPIEQASELIGGSVSELYDAIGQPADSKYASSCLGDGEDGELYYDGFTVYTYRDIDGSENIYDVMERAD